MNRLALILVAAVLAALAPAAHAMVTPDAPPRWPGQPQTSQAPVSLKLFDQLKQRVTKQGRRLNQHEKAIGLLDDRITFMEECSPLVIDLGVLLDYYVGPLHGSSWTPLANQGLYALAVVPECVEETPTKAAKASPARLPDGLLRRMRP